MNGSHTTVLKGGEQVGYQGRKKRKTTNALNLDSEIRERYKYLLGITMTDFMQS